MGNHLLVELTVGCPACGAPPYSDCRALFMGREQQMQGVVHSDRANIYRAGLSPSFAEIGRTIPDTRSQSEEP